MSKPQKKNESLRYPSHWIKRKQNKQKISILTVYDASFARLLAHSHVDALLVGDSLGMVVQGHNSTIPVHFEDTIYHCRIVRRGAPDNFIIGDMPFASYQISTNQAIKNGLRLLQAGRVNAVKVEGAHPDLLLAIEKLSNSGVPVMGHVGMTPQSYPNTSGFSIQGRGSDVADRLLKQALLLQSAGCFAVVLELIVSSIAKKITEKLDIPTIGIGSGAYTSGQVLVFHDFLGLNLDFHPRHAKIYSPLGEEIIAAANRYHTEVQAGDFPKKEHSFE